MYSQLTVGERLKLARKSKGFTQEELGEAIKVGKSQISNIEKGTSELTRANAIVLSGKLGIELDWLLHGEGKGPREGNGNNYLLTGDYNPGANVGTASRSKVGSDDALRKELEECRKEVELWRNKYIALLEKMAQ